MSVEVDYKYLESLMQAGEIGGPAIEIGSRIWPNSDNAEALCRRYGMEWTGADMEPGPGVDIVMDILDAESVAAAGSKWDSVLVMNLLEHVYDPILALRNCCSLVAPGGACVVVTPIMWQIHDYPRDFWRPLPDFYLEFARREGLETSVDDMRYLTLDQVIPVGELTEGTQKKLPSKAGAATRLFGSARSAWSRTVHKALNTYGRDCHFPMSGLGVVIRKPT